MSVSMASSSGAAPPAQPASARMSARSSSVDATPAFGARFLRGAFTLSPASFSFFSFFSFFTFTTFTLASPATFATLTFITLTFTTLTFTFPSPAAFASARLAVGTFTAAPPPCGGAPECASLAGGLPKGVSAPAPAAPSQDVDCCGGVARPSVGLGVVDERFADTNISSGGNESPPTAVLAQLAGEQGMESTEFKTALGRAARSRSSACSFLRSSARSSEALDDPVDVDPASDSILRSSILTLREGHRLTPCLRQNFFKVLRHMPNSLAASLAGKWRC
mmetsp:Transcript_42878/g.102005  ORF Transcript_42878/g.102005 Transcript_42878/m.102005 type:complete len:279 (+) Transcript_42878:396-1232(+)